MPRWRVCGGVCEAEQGWRDTGTEGYVEAVKGNRGPAPRALHVSSFSGQHWKKACTLAAAGKASSVVISAGEKKRVADIPGGAFRIYNSISAAYARLPGEGERAKSREWERFDSSAGFGNLGPTPACPWECRKT